MSSRATAPTRRSRTSLDRDVDETMRRRRRERMLRRCIRTEVSEADVLIWLFGLLSLLYCVVGGAVELIRMCQ